MRMIQHTPEEMEFLETVERLGLDGKNHEEIAAHFGFTRGTLYYRLGKLGYDLEQFNRLRSVGLKRRYRDLKDAGQITVAAEKAPVAA